MGELDAGARALRVDELDDAGEACDVFVFVDAEVVWGDAAFGYDGGGLKQDQSGTALGAGTEMDHVPVVGEAVECGVLAHGRDADAVRESD